MSQLQSIIQRLQSMQSSSQMEQAPQRMFEVNGKLICQVKYMPAIHTFEVEEYGKHQQKQTYQFDNIDIAAIEIFEIIQEEQNQIMA